MKRIIIFSVAYYPFVGGAEIAVREIARRITGVEFHLVTVNLNGKEKAYEKIDDVHVYRVGRALGAIGEATGWKIAKYFFPILGTLKALRLHHRLHFSAAWSIMAEYAGFATLFFTFLKPQVKFILTLQEGDPIEHLKRRAWIAHPLFLMIFKRANVIQTISNFLAGMARDFGATAPIHVIQNGVDTGLFAREYSVDEIENLKQTVGKILGDRWLVTTSRLVVKNGVDTVIRALPLLPENVSLLVLGEGELEGELKNLAFNLEVEKRVVFLGFISHEDMPKYLKVADVFVRPSRSEGLGNSFIEAMAAGLPVIATNVGGIPDFLTHGETGLFCEVDNHVSLASSVMTLLEDADLRSKVITKGRELAISEYNWENIAKDMEIKIFSKV